MPDEKPKKPQTPAQKEALAKGQALGSEAAKAAREAKRAQADGVVEKKAAKLDAECETRGKGALSDQVRQFNLEIAHTRWLRQQAADDYLRRYRGATTVQAAKKISTSVQLTKLVGDLLEAREVAIAAGIREAARPNGGVPVVPKRNPEHVIQVALLLIGQGAIPDPSPETREIARSLLEAMARDKAVKAAAKAEIEGLTKSTHKEKA